MKKIILMTFFLIFLSPLFSQNSQRQVVIPKQIFVGDTGELQISFSSEIDFFKNLSGNQTLELFTQNFTLPLDDTEYTVKKILLSKTGKNSAKPENVEKPVQINYVFSIIFTPWKTGEIKIPPYNLGNNLGLAFDSDQTSNDFILTPSEIIIDSILDQKNIKSNFIPGKGPVLLPGTTYKIYFQIIILLLFIALLIRVLVKWQEVNLFIKNIKLRLLYRKNKLSTIKILTKLKSSANSDREIADIIQIVMRNYLQVRFSYPFTKAATNEIMKGFDEIYAGLLSDEKTEAVEELTGIFIRTDYVRYGKEGEFIPGEKNKLIDSILEIIAALENTKETEKVDGGQNA